MAGTPLLETRRPRRREGSDFTRDVLAHVAERLEQLLEDVEAAGVEPGSLGAPEELARRMVATIPQPSPWVKAVGPVYTTSGVRAMLGGVSRQAIEDRINRGTLFALTTADRRRVFPVFQFDDRGTPVDGLADVLAVLKPAADDWTVASWLHHPQRALGRRSPIRWLRDGRDRKRLDALVHATASRWAR